MTGVRHQSGRGHLGWDEFTSKLGDGDCKPNSQNLQHGRDAHVKCQGVGALQEGATPPSPMRKGIILLGLT